MRCVRIRAREKGLAKLKTQRKQAGITVDTIMRESLCFASRISTRDQKNIAVAMKFIDVIDNLIINWGLH